MNNWNRRYPEKNKDIQKRYYSKAKTATAENRYKRYTEEEKMRILNKEEDDFSLAICLGRSIKAIETKRAKMKGMEIWK